MELNNKVTVLNLIKENKNILFGKFNNELTHEHKIKKWKEIADQLKSLGIFSKDWKYLRDTTWQNWRKRSLEKRENCRFKYEAGEAKKIKFDESDKLIFEIVEKKFSEAVSLKVPILGCPQASTSNDESLDESTGTSESDYPTETRVLHHSMEEIDLETNNLCTIKEEDVDVIVDLKRQKLEAEVALAKVKLDITKRERYKMDLDLFKLEKELNIKPSTYTVQFYTNCNCHSRNNESGPRS